MGSTDDKARSTGSEDAGSLGPVAKGASAEEQPELALGQAEALAAPLAPVSPGSAAAALLTPNDCEVMAAMAEAAEGEAEAETTGLQPTTDPSDGPMRNEHSGGMAQTPSG